MTTNGSVAAKTAKKERTVVRQHDFSEANFFTPPAACP